MEIIITRSGFWGNGVYIGRPSYYGNPFPIKPSKYSKKVYSLQESLWKYVQLLQKGKINIHFLVERLVCSEKLVLDCWCVRKKYSIKNLTFLEREIFEKECSSLSCHGEILAYFLFKEVVD